MPKTRNIIIFVSIAVVIFALYYLFLKPDPAPVSSLTAEGELPNTTEQGNSTASAPDAPKEASDFLTLLLNVKNIRLEAALFADPAFKALKDSSIIITSDGTEGRPNPFAPLGRDILPPTVTPESPETTPTTGETPEEELNLDDLMSTE